MKSHTVFLLFLCAEALRRKRLRQPGDVEKTSSFIESDDARINAHKVIWKSDKKKYKVSGKGSKGAFKKKKKKSGQMPPDVLPCSKYKSKNTASVVAVPEDSPEMDGIRQLMTVRKHSSLGSGSDTKKFPSYKDLQVISAWRVHNPNLHNRYRIARSRIAKSDRVTVPYTRDFGVFSKSVSLSKSHNEIYFFHGTPPQNVISIACEGMRAGGGLFGQGAYLADVFDKSDQYATHYGEGDSKIMDAYVQNESVYALESAPVFYNFIVRATLGNTYQGLCNCSLCEIPSCKRCGNVQSFDGALLRTKKKPTHVVPLPQKSKHGNWHYYDQQGRSYDSICVQRAPKSCIKRYNECVVPIGSNRVDVLYIVAYKRCKKVLEGDTQCETVKLSKR